ncbi:MAG: MFS transporter [Thermomicrobiales bacterium]|nr:MFS transporter [Thermomicrobiales bacterium]
MGRTIRLDPYRLYLLICAASTFFLWLAFSVNLVFQVERVGLSPLQLVLVGTVLEATCFLFEIPTGIVADVYSRRLSVIIGMGLLGAGLLVVAVPSFLIILLGNVIMGIGYTFLSGAQEAWIVDEIGERRAGPAFLRGSQASQIGTLIATPIGVGLATFYLNLPIIIAGFLMLGLAGFLIAVMTEHGFQPTPREDRSSWGHMRETFLDGARLTRRRPLLLTIFAITFFFGMASEGFDRLSPAHLLDSFTLPTFGGLQSVVWYGILTFSAAVLKIVFAEVLRRRIDTSSHKTVTRSLLFIDTLLVIAMGAFALAGNFTFAAVAFVVATVLRGLNAPLTSAWINQSIDPRVRATVISMSGQADALGQIAGGPGIGAIGSVFSLRAALSAATVALLPSLLLYGRALGQGEKPLITADAEVVTHASSNSD